MRTGDILRRALILSVIFLWGTAVVWAGRRVLVVRSSALPLYEQAVQGFRQCAAAEIVGDHTYMDDPAKIEAMISDVRAKVPDVVLTLGSSATRLIRERLPGQASVFCMVIDPSANGFGPPGIPLELRASAQLDFIKGIPQLKRVGVIHNPAKNREVAAELKDLQSKGAPIVLVEASSPEGLEAAVQSLSGKADCLLMLSDPQLYSPQTAPQLILNTLQRGLPIVAPSPAYVKAGALAGIYASPDEMGCLAAGFAAKIFAGEKSSALPYGWATKAKSAVNLVVAERLKIQIPAAVTNNAEQVIK
jgi:putative tryptophan/tyrosine transport system substrate-binding protein